MTSLRIGPAAVPLLLLFAVSPEGFAQQPFSLPAAIEMARASNSLLQAADGRTAEARALVDQARLRPNPRGYLQTEAWRAWGSPSFQPMKETDTYAYLSMPVEVAGKRAARTELARRAATKSQLQQELVERQVIARIKQSYWAAAGAERILHAQQENAANFRQVIEYHELRVREGVMPEADLLRVRLEGERLEMAANSAGLEAEKARIELFRAIGTEEHDVRLTEPLEPPSSTPVADVKRALEERTEMKLALQSREVAAANITVQKSLAHPDVEILGGYLHMAGHSTLLGGAQWNLPLFNRNQGNIAAAQASARVSESEIAATAAVIRAEVRAAGADVTLRARQISGTLERMRQQAAESARIAMAAYREGGVDLLRLLDAERLRIETETLYYRTLAEFRQSVVALEAAMGVSQ
ncbi:MAG: TolC family protein [Bryobacterales bacterium]|nr:TolC family protein [Bryobacterales bacterium]